MATRDGALSKKIKQQINFPFYYYSIHSESASKSK